MSKEPRMKLYPSMFKLKVIDSLISSGNCKAEVGRRFNVPESTVRGWVKNADKIRETAAVEARRANLTADYSLTPEIGASVTPMHEPSNAADRNLQAKKKRKRTKKQAVVSPQAVTPRIDFNMMLNPFYGMIPWDFYNYQVPSPASSAGSAMSVSDVEEEARQGVTTLENTIEPLIGKKEEDSTSDGNMLMMALGIDEITLNDMTEEEVLTIIRDDCDCGDILRCVMDFDGEDS